MEAGYRIRLHLRLRGEEVSLGIRRGRLRLERGSDHAVEFDPEGRILRREKDGESWRLTLDGRVLRVAGEARARHRLPSLAGVDEELAAEAGVLRELLDAGPALDDETREWTARAARFDADALRADREKLRRIYQPIPVLPPDQYDALVVQLTEGCPYDRCSFCQFYRGVSHRIRDDAAFARHFDALLAHLGRSVERCSRVFLGQANAMLAPGQILRSRLEAIGTRLGLVPESLPPQRRRAWRQAHPTAIDGFYSFVDAFHRGPGVEDLRELRHLGLRRLYLGLESGSQGVLELLGKPTPAGAVEKLAASLHEAEVSLAVIILVGAGGRVWRAEHETQTLGLLDRLELQRGDQVYLSRLVVHEGGDYALRAKRDGIAALDDAELEDSAARFRNHGRARLATGVVVADYDLRQISQWTPRA